MKFARRSEVASGKMKKEASSNSIGKEKKERKARSKSNPKRRANIRMMSTLVLVARLLASCASVEDGGRDISSADLAVAAEAASRVNATVVVSPTAFQPDSEFSQSDATIVTPLQEDTISLPTATLPPPVIEPTYPPTLEITDIDPLFESADSFVLKDPLEVVTDPHRAAEIAEGVHQRLVDLGIVQDSNWRPVTFNFLSGNPGYICLSTGRGINCYDNSNVPYLQPDASLQGGHEPLHENDIIPSGPLGEALAVMNQYIISGRNSRIADYYLFSSGRLYDDSNAVVYTHARELVEMITSSPYGVTDRDILIYINNYYLYRGTDFEFLIQGALADSLTRKYPQSFDDFWYAKARNGILFDYMATHVDGIGMKNPKDPNYMNFRVNVYSTGMDVIRAIQNGAPIEIKPKVNQ